MITLLESSTTYSFFASLRRTEWVILMSLLISTHVLATSDIQRGSFIRDAEIESSFKEFVTPLFQVAGLDPKRMHIYLIMNPDINAAASLNASLFINTGLIMESKSADQLIGVLAHETGHIAGEHIVRTQAAMQKATLPMIASVLLGTAVGVATGRSDASMAVIMGGMHLGEATFLHYSRGQESAADQAATKYLDKLGWSTKGLLEFMEILEKQDLLSSRQQDPYRLTHPLTKERINFLSHHVNKSPHTRGSLPARFYALYDRMKAKLGAFIAPAGHTLSKISARDKSVEGRYARAIALYRNHKLSEALKVINSLISEFPEDPYFHEFKGQMLFENGRIADALLAYQKALILKPDSDLIRIMYAQTLIETQKPEMNHKAIEELQKIKETEKDNPMLWRLLAIAYGRLHNMGMASLMLAEQALVEGDMKRATYHAERAKKQLTASESPAKQRARDIINEVNFSDEKDTK
ncbi:MAG: M48 family metallopeptidase [Alphaproteobacteria bacterium]|nr:M48 family metallopeptidase [Alphaproteobacteria bacterium]